MNSKVRLWRFVTASSLVLSLMAVGGCQMLKSAEPPIPDADSDGVADTADVCPGFDDTIDGDSDGVPDGCDVCPNGDDALDADGDGVPDACDVCPGFDDSQDDNGDGTPNGCDQDSSFRRADLESFAVFAVTGDSADLSNLRVGDEIELSVPDDTSLPRILQQQTPSDGCSCTWSVQPPSAGTFDPMAGCTTMYTVDELGDAVIAAVQTCGGVAREFFNGLHAEAAGQIEIAAVAPQAIVSVPSDHCPDETICVFEGETVALDGSDSTGFTQLSFQWEQIGGPRVPLVDPQSPDSGCCNPTNMVGVESPCTHSEICQLETVQFVAPTADAESEPSLQFQLTVTDEQRPGIFLTHTTQVTVLVTPCPVANAGDDHSVPEGTSDVRLTGSQNTDQVGVGFIWRQIAGPDVTLSDPNDPSAGCCDPSSDPVNISSCTNDAICHLASPQFDAPLVSSTETLEFELDVSIGGCLRSDTVRITVNDAPGGGGGGGGGNPCAGITCDDGNDCTTGACVGGACVFTNATDGAMCSDGNECTVNDHCVAGACIAINAPDGVVCTQDSLFCNGTEVCTAGVCTSPGTLCDPLDCNDELDRCEGCTFAADCPDITCMTKTCDTSGDTAFCVYTPSDTLTACDDGYPCSVNDHCDGLGSCVAEIAVNCSAQDDACNTGVCNVITGACEPQPANDGAGCDDGDACTQNTICSAGSCTGGSQVPCDDGDPCTTDSCDSVVGCQFTDPCGVATPATPFCDPTTTQCVECLTNAHCPDGFCDSNNTCQPGTPVTGNLFRGDYDPPTTNGTPATGRSITVQIRRGDENGMVLASVSTSTGSFQLVVPDSEFLGGPFNGTLTIAASPDVLASPILNIALAIDQPVTNLNLVVFYQLYVDNPGDGIGVDGDDGNDGTQAPGVAGVGPLATIQATVDRTFPGDTVFVRNGTYTVLNVTFPRSGQPGRPITVAGFPGDPRPIIQRGSLSQTVFLLDTPGWSNFIFKDLVLRTADFGIIFNPPQLPRITDIRVENVEFYDFVKAGIRGNRYGVERLYVKNCHAHDMVEDRAGFDFFLNTIDAACGGGSQNVIIQNCVFNHQTHPQAIGVIAEESTRNFIYINNLSYDNGEIAFASKSGGYNIYINNIGYDQGKAAYYLRDAFRVLPDGQVIEGCGKSNYLLLNNIGVTHKGGEAGNQGVVKKWPKVNVWAYNNTFISLKQESAPGIGAPIMSDDPTDGLNDLVFLKNNILYKVEGGRVYYLVGHLTEVIHSLTGNLFFVENQDSNYDAFRVFDPDGSGGTFTLAQFETITGSPGTSQWNDPLFAGLDVTQENVLPDLHLQAASPAINMGEPYGTVDANDYPTKIEEFLVEYNQFADFTILSEQERQALLNFIRTAYLRDRDGVVRNVNNPSIGAYEN